MPDKKKKKQKNEGSTDFQLFSSLFSYYFVLLRGLILILVENLVSEISILIFN